MVDLETAKTTENTHPHVYKKQDDIDIVVLYDSHD